MIRFRFNEDKAVNSLLYILSEIGEAVDFHKIFKILYFSERKHLAEYGRPVSGDSYIAMEYGTVPSVIYDVLKAIRDDYGYNIDVEKFNKYFSVERIGKIDFVGAKVLPNLEYLSESDLECLIFSINDNKNLSFEELVKKSHDFAWNENKGNTMSIIDIAWAGGANEEMLKYITHLAENEFLILA